MNRSAHGWRLASLPFYKFFNQSEVECPVRADAAFAELAPRLDFIEKADGTGIQLWYMGEEACAANAEQMQNELQSDGTIVHRKERDDDEHARIVAKLRQGSERVHSNAEALLTPEERRSLLYFRGANKKTGMSEGVRLPRLVHGWRIR